MKLLKTLIYIIIFLFIIIAIVIYKHRKIKMLENKIINLENCIQNQKKYASVKFEKIRPIIFPSSNILLKEGSTYKFNCFIAADYMLAKGNKAQLSISAKSKNHNNLHFQMKSGINELILSPTHLGIDTINLSYKFDFHNDSIQNIALPATLVVNVKKN